MMKKIRNILYGVAVLIALYFIITMVIPTNTIVKKFGGTAEMGLPPNTKLINVTWKENELWVLTRDMRANEAIETYKFSEKSKWGVLEGTYVFVEHE